MIKHFKKKPVVIEAVQYTPDSLDFILGWCGKYATVLLAEDGINEVLILQTLESNDSVKTRHAATLGDYVIKGVQGEFYFCKPDIFELTYEEVSDVEGR